MNEYFSLAVFYDRLMRDVDYSAWADYYDGVFKASSEKIATVIDLACGTGVITAALAEKGYEMIGVDLSAEMLDIAKKRAENAKCAVAPIFINQDLTELDLYGTADAAICSFDGMSYIHPDDINEVFHRLSYFVRPGGLVIFDVNTEDKFRRMDGQTYIDEDDELFCVWRTDYYEDERACVYGVDLFWREGELWRRGSEEHTEYAHSEAELTAALENNGFGSVKLCGELSDTAPVKGCDRIFYLAERMG